MVPFYLFLNHWKKGESNLDMETCFFCGISSCNEVTLQKCPHCDLVSYCCQRHEKLHRPKNICYPVRIERHPTKGKKTSNIKYLIDIFIFIMWLNTFWCSSSFNNLFSGTYLVATRDIKPLETIVDQYPLIHGPYAKPPQPQCLECHKILEEVKDKDKNGNETST